MSLRTWIGSKDRGIINMPAAATHETMRLRQQLVRTTNIFATTALYQQGLVLHGHCIALLQSDGGAGQSRRGERLECISDFNRSECIGAGFMPCVFAASPHSSLRAKVKMAISHSARCVWHTRCCHCILWCVWCMIGVVVSGNLAQGTRIWHWRMRPCWRTCDWWYCCLMACWCVCWQ